MKTCMDVFSFRGKMSPALTAAVVDGPWAKADTSAAGAPTATTTADGLVLSLDATNEAQNLCVYFGDILAYDIDDLIRVSIYAKLTAALDAAVSAAFGMAGARNDTIDSIAQHALFRAIGSNSLVVETDDGTTDKDDIATGLSLSTSLRRHDIDFKTGVQTRQPGLSLGGKANVQFSAENSAGLLRRVAQDTVFDMSAYDGGLQPFFQLQKTAAAATASLTIRRVEIEYRM